MIGAIPCRSLKVVLSFKMQASPFSHPRIWYCFWFTILAGVGGSFRSFSLAFLTPLALTCVSICNCHTFGDWGNGCGVHSLTQFLVSHGWLLGWDRLASILLGCCACPLRVLFSAIAYLCLGDPQGYTLTLPRIRVIVCFWQLSRATWSLVLWFYNPQLPVGLLL